MSEARPLMRKAQQRTPVDTGALRDSYELHGPKEERDEVSVTITVGGPEAPYAAAVHENQEIRHASGRSKFLESTVLEERRSLGRGLARAFKLEKVVR